MKKGKLYLLPTPLGETEVSVIPDYVIQIMHSLEFFIAEKAKTARRFIKSTGIPRPISDLTVYELNKRTTPAEWKEYLQAAEQGNHIGLMSEAGCPGIADPGAVIIEMAHKKGIEVVPLVGPSSILLALIASGLNGQSFCFHGYLSPKPDLLAKDFRRVEQLAKRQKQTQIFIETPYRNNKFIEKAIKTLAPNTRFCIAANLTLDNQYIVTKTIADWKKTKVPDLHKQPAVFLLL